MPVVELESSGRFGSALHEAMERKGVGLRELAALTDGTYEHMRKLIKGLAYPSKYLLKELCRVLGTDESQMDELITQDKLEHKFGDKVHSLMGNDPNLQRFAPYTPYLSAEQLEMFETQMKAVVRGNRRRA